MSPIMTSDSRSQSASVPSADMPMNNVQGGEMTALAGVLSQPRQTTTTASLLGAVKTKGGDIRAYIDAGGSWDELVPALAKDLKQAVKRKTLETYMAKHHTRRPKALRAAKLIVPDFKGAPADSPSVPRQSTAPLPSAGGPHSAPVPTTSAESQKVKQGVNRFVGPR